MLQVSYFIGRGLSLLSSAIHEATSCCCRSPVTHPSPVPSLTPSHAPAHECFGGWSAGAAACLSHTRELEWPRPRWLAHLFCLFQEPLVPTVDLLLPLAHGGLLPTRGFRASTGPGSPKCSAMVDHNWWRTAWRSFQPLSHPRCKMGLHAHCAGVLLTMTTSCDANKKTASRSRVCHLFLRLFYDMVYLVRVCGLVLSCPEPCCVFTKGRGLTVTRASFLARAPIDGPGSQPTDVQDRTLCVVRALMPTLAAQPTHVCVIAKKDWAVSLSSHMQQDMDMCLSSPRQRASCSQTPITTRTVINKTVIESSSEQKNHVWRSARV